jgi:hypothetical protein
LEDITGKPARPFLVVLYENSGVLPELQSQQDDLPGKNKAMNHDNIRPETFYITMIP